MKEILFRAWSKTDKQIIPVWEIGFKRGIINSGSAWRTFEEIELMQYIQTINGFEIYVGDIVMAYKYGDKETKPIIRNIEKRKGTYMFGEWTWLEFLDKFRYVEVIGNIYEINL